MFTAPLRKVVFVGSFGPDSGDFRSPAFSRAGNMAQLGLLQGLRSQGIKVLGLAFQPMPAFLSSSKFYVKPFRETPTTKDTVWIGYLNLPYVKQLLIGIGLLISLLRIVKLEKPDVIISYNVNSFILLPSLTVAKWFKIPYVPLVYDLPLPNGTVKESFLQRLDLKVFRNFLKYCDLILVGSEFVAHDFAENKAFMLIESGITREQIEEYSAVFGPEDYTGVEPFHILFAGSLEDFNGIHVIIDAFRRVNDERVHLHFAGKGSLAKFVEDASLSGPNITFHGYISMRQLQSLYSDMHAVINHRTPGRNDTRYGFSSKLVEYLLIGRPILATKFECLPKSYLPYLQVIDDASAPALADAIITLMEHYTDAVAKAERGREFVIAEKTWDRHAGRIKAFLEDQLAFREANK